MRRRRGSTHEYVQRDDLEPRARRSGVLARQAGVKTHCLLRAAASLMRDEDKGSEGGR